MARCTRRVPKNESANTKSASARSRAIVEKAASISSLVLAMRTMSCSPSTRAAASRSLTLEPVLMASVGLASTAIRDELVQKPKPFCSQLADKKVYTGGVAARSAETCHKAKPDRVIANAKDNWNCRSRGLSCPRCRRIAWHGNYAHLSLD